MATVAPHQILWRLSDESTVDAYLLAEDEGLATLVKSGAPFEALLEYVNENY